MVHSSSARLRVAAGEAPALGTGSTVLGNGVGTYLDLMCVLFVVVMLSDFTITTELSYADGATVGVPLPATEGHVAPERKSACWQMAPASGRLQALCRTCSGPPGRQPVSGTCSQSCAGLTGEHIVTAGAGSSLKGPEVFGMKHHLGLVLPYKHHTQKRTIQIPRTLSTLFHPWRPPFYPLACTDIWLSGAPL